jgi:suppressor for copper-sensitivity B
MSAPIFGIFKKTLSFALGASLWALALPAHAGSSPWAESEHAQARLIAEKDAVGAAPTIRVALQIRLDDGWHTYWRTPGDAGVPPEFDWSGSEGIREARVHWPVPKRLVEGDLVSLIYEREVVLPIEIASAAPGRPIALVLKAVFGVCADICIPVEAAMRLDLPDGAGQATPFADLIERHALRVPRRDASAGLGVAAVERPGGALRLRAASTAPFVAPDLLIEGGGFGAEKPRIALSPDRREATFELAAPKRPAAGPLVFTLIDGPRAHETTRE